MTWLHEQHLYKRFVAIHCDTNRNKADMNTKAHGREILQEKHLSMVGFRIYLPKGSIHSELLTLSKYNMGVHRGSFLLDPGRIIYKSKEK